VVVGTAAAGHALAWRVTAAALVALGLQVGVNFANDYFDGVRGVDPPERLGPPRLTASGAASPRAVALAAGGSFAVAAAAGLALAVATHPALILPAGAIAIAAALLYSGGPRPYAGLGLGEASVFVFFGLMATCGSAYVQVERIPVAAWWSAIPVGLLAVAILVANNLRDIPTDAATGKRTLAVRLGVERTVLFYRSCLAATFVSVPVGVAAGGLPAWAMLSLAAVPLAIRPAVAAGRVSGRALIAVLVGTAALQAAFGILLAVGLWAG